MTPERWQQVKSTLAEALEHDTAERAALLDSRCAGDTDLRRDVESLLRSSNDVLEGFAEAGGVLQRVAAANRAGRRIGAYELVRELGRGGMGTVWLATRADKEFHKEVAIKLLKRGTDTDEVLRRFRAEREILARLEHPNIARLLDAGTTEDGLPYFVMEYVDGVRVTNFIAAKELPLKARLQLFLKICGAVQFAHQNLVVHRDLKPGNILVNGQGEPKLLDFGVAKLLAPDDEALLVTMAGQERFTPAYASPEQVRGEAVTTLSDVYSAGSLLYEMLTGANAHRFSTAHPPATELLRVVTEQEPLRPSAAATDPAAKRRLRGDLDNIIAKALRKEPARRYPSMGAFAADIRRYLDDRPVTARPDTFAYRASKFVQRNKLGVAAATLLLLTLVGGIIATTWQARVARENFNEVRQLARSVLFDYHDAIAKLPGSTPVRQKLVSDSLQYLDRLTRRTQRDPSLQREVASAYVKVGDVQGRPNFANLGDTAGALASYGKAIEIFDQLATRHSADAALQAERAGAYARLGELRRQLNELDAAVTANRKAVAIMESVPTENASADVREALAFACLTLGDVLGNLHTNNIGDASGATANYRRALAIREELRRADPANAERGRNASIAHQRLGNMLQAARDYAGALEQYRAALAIDETLLVADPTNTLNQRNVNLSYQLLATVLLETDDLAGAREFQLKNVAMAESMAKADPQNALAKWDVALSLSRMVRVAGKSGDLPAARQFFDQAHAILSELLAKEPNNATYLLTLRATYTRMADVFNDLAHPGEAVVAASKVLELGDKLLSTGPNVSVSRYQVVGHVQRARAHTLLAADSNKPVAEQQEHWRAAQADYRQALRILEAIPQASSLPLDKQKHDEAIAGLAKCDAALTAR